MKFGQYKALLNDPKAKRYGFNAACALALILFITASYFAIAKSIESDRLTNVLERANQSISQLTETNSGLRMQMEANHETSINDLATLATEKEARINAFALQAMKCEAIKVKLSKG
jgi:hypothetical protein